MTVSESPGEPSSEPPAEQPREDNTALLSAALNHAWTWYDEHMKRVFQLVNFYIVATALLVTAYANSINKKQYGFAVALAIAGLVITAIASASALNQANAASKADKPLREMQDRIASKLETSTLEAGTPETSSFRIVDHQGGIRYNPWVASIMVVLAAGLFVVALIYATRH
jgi:beta-lactamase regulating signal transducer with metallopeptidase domain